MTAFDRYISGKPPFAPALTPAKEATTLADLARHRVYDYLKPRLEKTDEHVNFHPSEVYCVWFTKVLQNWKAMVSTTLPDGMYYEVTYNGDKRETYIDAYKRFDNVCVPD